MPLLHRILIACLALVLAMPAVQARDCSSAMSARHAMPDMDMSAHGHHGMAQMDPQKDQKPAPASISHECIGCIAPISIAAYAPVSVPTRFPALVAGPGNIFAPRLRALAPEPPPPRRPA